jgi:hypothetical protein
MSTSYPLVNTTTCENCRIESAVTTEVIIEIPCYNHNGTQTEMHYEQKLMKVCVYCALGKRWRHKMRCGPIKLDDLSDTHRALERTADDHFHTKQLVFKEIALLRAEFASLTNKLQESELTIKLLTDELKVFKDNAYKKQALVIDF